uniref:Nuclear cap-binding protein subunit 2 n=1 Tax=Pseudo-nitzschia arenysensis TaxID=697910 RepID=A0A7S0F7U9_9STRA|mmetsp:Transcript_578/g.1368  ORF Transcript_578/g.1368 Transcript_578/m.1368 type:complete len:235 (+) Transcript_578:47-751(+)
MNAEGPSVTADTTATAASAAAAPNSQAPPPTEVEDKPLPRAAELLFANSTEDKKLYWDRSHYDSPESQMKALSKSSTVYIGNMAFSTRSYNVHSHFSQIGPVRRVVMGMDRFQKTPCGFGFVEYAHRADALLAIADLTSTMLDGRAIRVELDAGFQPGRQYGRGQSGGQVRDDKRRGRIDPARNNPNKRQKTLNWTPAAKPPPPPAAAAMGDNVKQESGDAEMGQESNSRFRDE